MLPDPLWPSSRKARGGWKEWSQVTWKPSRKQPGFMPNGKGMLMLPHLSGQPGRVIGSSSCC
jgi:hypothetical protein